MAPGAKNKTLTLQEKEKEIEKDVKKAAKLKEQWEAEGWELLDPQKKKMKRIVAETPFKANLDVIPRRATRFNVFCVLWPLLDLIPSRKDASHHQKKVFLYSTAIRIFIYGKNSDLKTEKGGLKLFWEDPSFISKFQAFSMKTKLPYKYVKWSAIFVHWVAEIDDWFVLGKAWSTAVSRGEYLATDEKNLKTRCRSNPLISMVKEKSNGVVGIWFFQIACHLAGHPFLIACRPAKIFKGDKNIEVWAAWVKAFLPDLLPSLESSSSAVTGLSCADSLYGSSGSCSEFDEGGVPFLIGLKGGVFEHVQRQLKQVVKREGEFGVAWSHKLGRVVVCAWKEFENHRKFCVSNAYEVVDQQKGVVTRGGAVSIEVLKTYVTTSERPQNFSPALLRPNLTPSVPSVSPLPSPEDLPTGYHQVQCPHCACGWAGVLGPNQEEVSCYP